jgi:predicted nucleotidyltransferase
MIGNDQQLLVRVKEIVHQYDPRADIILYGSRARGDATPDSDWDHLILAHQGILV